MAPSPAPPTFLRFALVLVTLATLGVPLTAPGQTSPAPPVDFARDVEPLLVKRCSECHGPDAQKGGLRLDSRAAALKGGKSGSPALQVGKSAESELIQRLTTSDPDELMPPKGGPLTPAEIDLLRRWIDAGAQWPEVATTAHWAFRPVATPAIPQVKRTDWPKDDLDRFILARLEKEKLSPQVEADRATLLRRAALDLTGLPPTWSEIQAFLADPSPDAYAHAVDRLLASPHYGENMARGWLDLARYADSNGYQVDLARTMWPYRDWVIRAFNQNMPFDQFTIEQLAGDLLPHPTDDQLIATGFNRNTKINDEGGGDAEEYRVKAVKDRVATLGTAWLGLTLNCAECHSHKYDPVSQEDYYRLYAFFNNTADGGNYSVEPALSVPTPDLSETQSHLRKRLQDVQQATAQLEQELARQQRTWEREAHRAAGAWVPLELKNPVSLGGASYERQSDGSLLATGVNPIYDTITVEAETDLTGITAVQLEVLPDPSLPKNGPGRWGQTGNFILDEFSVSATPLSPGTSAAPAANLAIRSAAADWEQRYYRAEHAVDRNPKTGWAIGPRFGQAHFLIADLQQPAGFKGGTKLSFRFEHYHGNSHCVGRFRLSVTTERHPDRRWPVDDALRTVLARPPAERTAEDLALLTSSQHRASAAWRALELDRHQLEARLEELGRKKHATLIMRERTDTPRVTRVHVRGNFLDQSKEVSAGVPEAFAAAATEARADRLGLARWLVHPAHPLTSRVAVNRLWEGLFGTGIVKTSEDFGRQGEPPSHPELLDYLASEFMRSGWNVKALQRRLLLSATYRQAAFATPDRLEHDFYNRLLSRGPRFRMDAEMIRDHALAVSGLLNPKIGGPSVHPVQIANLWKEIGFLRPEIGMDEWPVSEGPDLYRRGVYTFWRRVCTYPTFATFDAPSRDICVARRPRTNTPLQALAALNDPMLLEAARAFAQRILAEGGRSDADRIDFAVRQCLGRPPTDAEHTRLLQYLKLQLKEFRSDAAGATALIQIGSFPTPDSLDARRLAAWMMLANVLFNLDETLTKG
ncbi:MAG: PSD1 domain-containing protein [Verrucomicrobiales bacterium]|nr:PSD1 domain-containing protein [Verrucomicrobiales bacterium]